MMNYKIRHSHLVYEKGSNEELEKIDEAIRTKILKWNKPEGKDFYMSKDGRYIHTIFQPTRNKMDALYLFEKFVHIEIEKDNGRYYACIYTGTTVDTEEGFPELIFFIEAESFELAVSLVVYESIAYYGE